MRFLRLTTRQRAVAFTACGLALFACVIPSYLDRLFRTELMTLTTRDRSHRAVLIRSDVFVDRNYIVKVDGQRVYVSPDFAPRHDLPYRETLLWDRTGRVVLLEIAGHRLFGYDVSRGRALTTSELLAAELPPEPLLWEYQFSSEWPGIGRADGPRSDARELQK